MALTTEISKSSLTTTLFRNQQQNAADLRQQEDLCRAFPVLERQLDNEHLERVNHGALIAAGALLALLITYVMLRSIIAVWQGGQQ